MARKIFYNCDIIGIVIPGYPECLDCLLSGWVIEDEYEAWRGLRGVNAADFLEDQFMLFDFTRLGLSSSMQVDMTDMLFPLDLVFVRYADTQPVADHQIRYQIEEVRSEVPVGDYCTPITDSPLVGWIEVNSGKAAELNWEAGDTVDITFGEPGIQLPPSPFTSIPPANTVSSMTPWLAGLMMIGMVGMMMSGMLKEDKHRDSDRRYEDEYGIRMPSAKDARPLNERPDIRNELKVHDQVAVLQTTGIRDHYRLGTVMDRGGRLVVSSACYGDINIESAHHVVRAEYPIEESRQIWLDSIDPRKTPRRFSPDTYADVYDSLIYNSRRGCSIDLEGTLRAAIKGAKNA